VVRDVGPAQPVRRQHQDPRHVDRHVPVPDHHHVLAVQVEVRVAFNEPDALAGLCLVAADAGDPGV